MQNTNNANLIRQLVNNSWDLPVVTLTQAKEQLALITHIADFQARNVNQQLTA